MMTKFRPTTFWRGLAGACALSLTLGASPATAASITYDFTAQITVLNNLDSETDPVPGLSLGDLVSGSLTYESGLALNPGLNISRQELIDSGLNPVSTPDNDGFHAGMADDVSQSFQVSGGPSFGTAPVFSISLNIGGNTYDISGDSTIRHRTNEWVPTPDRPDFAYDTLFAFAASDSGSLSGLRLLDDAVFSGLFPSDQTLSLLPDLSELFLARVFSIFDIDGDGVDDTQVFAAIDTLAVRVPEPATWLLLLTGLVTLRRFRAA